MPTEASLTKKAMDRCKEVMPGCVVLKHADKATSGHPDTSITDFGNTLWIEFKHCKDLSKGFESQGIQQLTCARLALHGRCIYVVFDTPRNKITILAPKDLGAWPNTGLSCTGFDYDWLAEQIKMRLQ